MAVLRAALGAALCLCLTGALAQAKKGDEKPFEPQVGQAGKDVIWVPTPEETVKGMLEMAKVTPKDFVIDLGSGDGRTVIAAARDFGARALGVEYDPRMVELSRRAAAAAGVADRAQFVRGDIFAYDFSRATVVTMYLLPGLNLKLRPKLLAMRPGTRVVSHAFDMGDWEPDQTGNPGGRRVMLWIVPARVGGRWELKHPGGSAELELSQTYQKLKGTMHAGSTRFEVRDGVLNGDAITFTVAGPDGESRVYIGRVSGGTMRGTLKSGGEWSATRRR